MRVRTRMYALLRAHTHSRGHAHKHARARQQKYHRTSLKLTAIQKWARAQWAFSLLSANCNHPLSPQDPFSAYLGCLLYFFFLIY